MLFHTVLVSAILPPRRQWCHVDVSRGAVREQNLHSTPKRRPVGDVMCTVAVHAIIDCGEQLDLRAAKSAVRAEKKETKAQLSRARKPRRGVKWGKAPLDFRLTRSGSTTGWGQQKSCGQLILPRAWKRSIGGCGKLVKKNSYPNHKILCSRCRKRLPIVVSMLTDAASSTCGKCVRANENRRGKISQSVAIAKRWACGRKRKQHC